MTSPPQSPPQLQGVSCMTGGILQNQAVGHVYNLTDGMEVDRGFEDS
jgi:hypothetical protein